MMGSCRLHREPEMNWARIVDGVGRTDELAARSVWESGVSAASS